MKSKSKLDRNCVLMWQPGGLGMKADQILLRVMGNLCELAKLAEGKLSFRKTADFSDALEAFPTWADRVARSQFFGKREQGLSHNLDHFIEQIRQETHVSCWHQLAQDSELDTVLEKYTKDKCGREKEFWCIVETNCLNIQQSFPILGAEDPWLVDLDQIRYIDDERNTIDEIFREGFHLFHFPYLFTKRSKWRWENEARFVMSSWGQGNVLPGWRSVQGLDPLPSIMYCVVDPAIFVDTIWFSEKRHYYAALRKIPTLGENFRVRLEAKEMIVKDLALKAREAVPLIDTLALKNDYQE